jgi:F-type H+-transporting ATPase subunit b
MDQTPLAVLASGNTPLIDLDLTAVVQFVLFLVVYLIASSLLFKPYLALREKRRAGIEGARAEAERMTAQADARLADYQKQLAVARDRAGEQGRKIRLEAASHEREVTDKARAQAQAAIDAANARMRAETEAARQQLLPQAEQIARTIAKKLLGREVA